MITNFLCFFPLGEKSRPFFIPPKSLAGQCESVPWPGVLCAIFALSRREQFHVQSPSISEDVPWCNNIQTVITIIVRPPFLVFRALSALYQSTDLFDFSWSFLLLCVRGGKCVLSWRHRRCGWLNPVRISCAVQVPGVLLSTWAFASLSLSCWVHFVEDECEKEKPSRQKDDVFLWKFSFYSHHHHHSYSWMLFGGSLSFFFFSTTPTLSRIPKGGKQGCRLNQLLRGSQFIRNDRRQTRCRGWVEGSEPWPGIDASWGAGGASEPRWDRRARPRCTFHGGCCSRCLPRWTWFGMKKWDPFWFLFMVGKGGALFVYLSWRWKWSFWWRKSGDSGRVGPPRSECWSVSSMMTMG